MFMMYFQFSSVQFSWFNGSKKSFSIHMNKFSLCFFAFCPPSPTSSFIQLLKRFSIQLIFKIYCLENIFLLFLKHTINFKKPKPDPMQKRKKISVGKMFFIRLPQYYEWQNMKSNSSIKIKIMLYLHIELYTYICTYRYEYFML